MAHPLAQKTTEQERALLVHSVKTNLIADLNRQKSFHTQYMETLNEQMDVQMEAFFGADAVLRTVGRIWFNVSKIKACLTDYIEARANNRLTDVAEQALITSAGPTRAAQIMTQADKAIENEVELREILAEYGAAYAECALDIATPIKEKHMQDSEESIMQIAGKKRAGILTEMIQGRVDAELNDSLGRLIREKAGRRL